ncbi:MAG: hypothetical protein ACRDT8_18270 [Micromonosporaceae bacterium]
MAMQAELVEMLRALLVGDFDAVDAHVDRIEGQAGIWEAGTGLLNAAFWLAANRRFSADTSLQEISDYVAEVRRQYPDTETMVAEALIRVARGEEHLLDGLKPESALPVEMVLIHKMISDEGFNDGQREAFVSESVRLAESSV